MSSLTRVNYVAQQRVDLHHLLAAESYTAFDFRSLISAFVGSKSFILSGFEVIGRTGLAVTINLQNSITFNPLDGNGSFYRGLSDDSNAVIELPASQENLFVEAKFSNTSKNPVNTAYWDPLALTGEDVAGTEYSASSNSQVLTYIVISVNTIGFSEDAIPIMRASTDGSNVTKMIDCRPLFFRLGSGGVTPNAAYRYPWATQRTEPVSSGAGVGDATNSPFRSSDLTGAINDKGIRTFKEWCDAVMTRIAEISGSPLWYVTDSSPNNPVYGYITGLDAPRIYLDSEAGHAYLPSTNVSMKWTRQNPNLPISPSNYMVLRTEGQSGGDDASTVKWQANYGPVKWELGGVFTSNTPGGSRTYSNARLESPEVADGGSLYLFLERDVKPPLGSGNTVKWANNSAYLGFDQTKAISGASGDFTGIAVGDWVKKKSEGFSQYYQVVALSDGTIAPPYASVGDVASASIVAMELDRIIATGISTEEMIYFRSRYCQDDLHADTEADLLAGQYLYHDSNYYWLGRRVGTSFMLRSYGNMQEGEETLVHDDSFMGGGESGGSAGANELILEHATGAVYSVTLGYSLRASALPLLTIRRRKRDNTIIFPNIIAGDNSGALLTYTITSPIGLMTDGDGLWVRLSDTTSGLLTSGPVVISSDDTENLDTTTNKWQVLSPANTPLRNFDNKDVYLIARKITLANGDPALVFIDGSIVNQYGLVLDQFVDMTQDARLKSDLYLTEKTQKSVLFIDQYTDPFSGKGRVDEDNVSFSYDKAAQELTLFNNIFGVNYHHLISPTDQSWFTNLGPHSLYIGGSLSDIVIPGNLTVLGTETITSTQNIAIAGKKITLGVGNGLYGGGGNGIVVADNTIDWQSSPNKITQFQTYAGLTYVDVTFTSDPGYVIDQLVGVVSNFQLDQITEAEASQTYKRATTGSTVGDLQRMSATVWRFYTDGTALAGGIFTPAAATNWQIFDLLSEIHLGSSTDDPAYMTSWAFGVKRNPNNVQGGNEGTVHAIVTPYESTALLQDFQTIPTARQDNFHRMRIPYAWQDGKGQGAPGVSDTTFDFTDRLYWDYTNSILRVYGTFQLKGNAVPEDDNTWDLGTTSMRWKTLHVGPGSVIVHNDATNTNWANLSYTGALAQVTTDSASALLLRSASTNQFKLFTDKRGSFGLAQASSGDASAVFEFGNDATNVLASTTQYGTKIAQRLSGSTASYLMHLAAVAAGGSIGVLASIHLADATIASGSVTTQYGILIDDFATGSNKYGIYSNLGSASNKWFLYSAGLADSYFAGNVGIGNSTQATIDAYRLVIGTTSDTTAAGGILLGGDVQMFRSSANILKINNKAWISDIAAIGTSGVSSDSALVISGTPASLSGTTNYGVKSTFTPPNTATSKLTAFSAALNTPAFGSGTVMTEMVGFEVLSATLNTNATVTTLSQFKAADLTVGSNNIFAFYSLMSSGSNKWGLYLSGNATNFLSGNTGIGNNTQSQLTARLTIGTTSDTTPAGGMQFGTDTNLYRVDTATLRTNHTLVVQTKLNLGATVGTDAAIAIVDPTFTQGVAAFGVKNIIAATAATTTMFLSKPTLAGALTTVYGYKAESSTTNGSATVYHFHADDSTTALYTNAYGFYSLMALGSVGSPHWAFYGSGTAPSLLNGPLSLGDANYTNATAAKLHFVANNVAAGGIDFGLDTNLYRVGASILRTDHTIVVQTKLNIGATVGTDAALTIGDASFTQGATSYGVKNILTSSAATLVMFMSKPTLSAGITTLYGHKAETQAANLVATLYHFHADDSTTALATTAYAFYSAMNVGDATHAHWGFYGAGTAPHYLGGKLSLGESTYTTVINSIGLLYIAQGTTSANAINFGGGLSNIYRSAADTLKTDGNFIVGGTLQIGGSVTQTGVLTLQSALNLNYRSSPVTGASYSVTAADCVIPLDTSANVADLMIQLPSAATTQRGRILIIKDVAGYLPRLNKKAWLVPSGSDKIDGTNSNFLMDTAYESLSLVCNGSDGWFIW